MKSEYLNETCYRARDIQNGDVLFIGGAFPGVLNLPVVVDTDKFGDLFRVMDKNVPNLGNDGNLVEWLHKNAPGVDVKTFAVMYAYDNALRRLFPNMSAAPDMRRAFYEPGRNRMLSDAFANGVCQCAEISILAQICMQKYGVDSAYICGEYLSSGEQEFGDAHSFLQISDQARGYFYEPANPLNYDGRYMPTLSHITPTNLLKFESRISGDSDTGHRRCAHVAAKNVFTHRQIFYGYGDGMNVFPEFIINNDDSNVFLARNPER